MPGRPEIFPFDDKAAVFYRDIGYSGVYFENDYHRFGSPATDGCWAPVNEALSLWRFSQDPAAELYLKWLTEQVGIAHRNGLKIYLKAWDPRVPISQARIIPREARGLPPTRICLSTNAGENLIYDYHLEALRNLKMIDGLIICVDDNYADICLDDCPNCSDIPFDQRLAKYWKMVGDVVTKRAAN